MLSSQTEIRDAYRGSKTAQKYIAERFESELTRLLHDRQVGSINALMATARPRTVLEIAPGPGRLTRAARAPGTLVCVEYNQGMIEQGRLVSDAKACWVRGDGFQLPFKQGFDLVYTFRFIRHFHREDRERVYAEIRRVLKPGGYFVMDAVNENVSKPLREAHPEEYPVYDKLYRRQDLCAELCSADLLPLSLLPVQKFFACQYRSQVLLGPRANWMNRWAIRFLERLPRQDGLEWVVTCRRG